MDLRKRSDWVDGLRVTVMMSIVMLVALCGILMPQTAEAQPNKKTSTKCSQCHNGALDPGMTVHATVDGGAEGTSFSVSPGATIEIDFIFKGMRGYTPGRGVVPYLGLPAGWTPVATTNASNPTTLGGVAWNTMWNNPWSQGTPSDTPSWQASGAEDGTVAGFVSTNVFKGLFEGSSWENGSGSVFDDGTAGDLDGLTDVMGADVRLTVPVSGGPWTVFVGGVGHGTSVKALTYQAITISLAGGDSTAPVPNNDVAVSVESGTYVTAAFDVTATFAEPEGNVTGCEYTLNNGGSWSAGSVSGAGPYTCTANVTGQTNGATLDISMRMTSGGGLSAASTYYPTRTVDTAAPTTTDNVPAGWQTSDVTVTLTPADAGSGVASTSYCVDQTNSCAPGTAYAAPFLVSTEGNNFVRYSSTDNLGNAQTVVSKTLDIDKTDPTDGALTPTPGDTQIQLDWTAASDATSGLGSPAYKVVMASGTTTPPADCSGAALYTGNLLTHTQTGLTNGVDYAFRVCAYDAAGLVSTGATATAQPSLVCTANTPSFTITQANQQINAGSGTVVYDVTVTNNDSGGCANSDFTLNVVSDSNGTDFAASTTGAMPLNIAPGGNAATTVTVTAAASPTNWNNNITTLNVSAAGHTTSANQTRTTWINLPVAGTLNYNTGETVHIEYQTTTRFASNGANALVISDSLGVSVTGTPFSLIEIQQGAGWVYFYNWDTSINGEPAETYNIEIVDATTSASSSVVLGNAANQMILYSDSNYTTSADIFDDLDTVYVEVQLSSAENGTDNPGGLYVQNWTGTVHDVSADTGIIETQTGGTVYRFNFIFDATKAGLATGDWGYVIWNEAAGPLRSFHRPIQFVTGGCASCTQSDPTLDILTSNQTINIEGSFVDYTIQMTNNDTVSCGSTTFTLTANDSDAGTIFSVPSTFPDLIGNQLLVPGASSSNTTMRVTAQSGQYSGTNDTDFSTDAANGHTAQNSFTDFAKRVTTTLSVPDLTAPLITINNPPNGSYLNAGSADPQTITGTASDNRGTVSSADVQIDGGAWNAVSTSDGYANWTWSWNLPVDGVHTIDARALDPSTNTGNATQISVTVDRTDPTTSDNISAAWNSTDRTVTLIETDATSGISSTAYCVDTANSCVPGTAYAAPFAVNQGASQENLQYVRYYSTDVAGNSQTLVSKEVRIDKKVPVDGASLTPTPGDTQIQLNWNTATDGGSGLDAVNTYKVVQVSGTTPPAVCSAAGIYTGTALTYTDTGLTNGNDYAYRVCAYDNVGLVSTGLAATAQPAAACVRANPTLTLSANQDITADGGVADYTVTVNNNDSGGCAAQTFDLTTFTDNGPSFTLSFPNGITTASIGVGANDATLIARVTANGGALNSATHTVGLIVDGSADPNHGDSPEVQAVTTMNVLCDVPPAVSWVTANQQITSDGGNAVYTLQVQNDNAAACGSASLDLVVVDDNPVAFTTPSVFATDPLSVNPGGGTNTTTLTVTAEVAAANLATNNVYFYTAVNGSIPQSGNSVIRTTTINRPCVPTAPSFSHAINKNVAPDGTAVYDLTIINNDVDCADSTFTFSIDSEVESNVGTFTLASLFSAPNVTVASGATNSTVTLSVTGNGTGLDGDTLTSTIRIADGSHADQTTVPVTTIKPFDPLVHSSASTGSTKWGSNWGVAGGKYGEFTCATCHTPSTTNIKRIRTALPTFGDLSPEEPTEDFPGSTISFLDATEPTTDFGDDTGGARANSTRICEVCHTYDVSKANGVIFHANDQQVAAGHEDSKDCTSCHKHNDGFSKAGATCDSCHGYPPEPGDAGTTPARTDDGFGYQAVEGKGAHAEHVNHLATLAGVTLDPNSDSYGDTNVAAVCGVCHDMNGASHEMGGGAGANRNINFNSSNAFQFGGAPTYNGIEDDPSATTPKTCSNINCHYQATPEWE